MRRAEIFKNLTAKHAQHWHVKYYQINVGIFYNYLISWVQAIELIVRRTTERPVSANSAVPSPKKDAMKSLLMLVFILGTLSCRLSHADTARKFVRIACIAEAGLLDVDFRYLHDSVSGDPDVNGQRERDTRLTQAGFHDPRGMIFSCVLGGVSYVVTAEQDQVSDRLCGGNPEVYLSLTRDGGKLLSNVIFGESCHQQPSITRLTVGDGPKSWRGRETEVCYSSGKDGEPGHCEWTFGTAAEFNKRFPIDEERLRHIVTGQERR